MYHVFGIFKGFLFRFISDQLLMIITDLLAGFLQIKHSVSASVYWDLQQYVTGKPQEIVEKLLMQ
jgi:hypothetical protein